jgi:hypothetical protein
MKIYREGLIVLALVCIFVFPAGAQEDIDWEVVQKIKTEGFKNSQAMEVAGYLTDVYGPRLANSPSYDEATRWAYDRLKSYGLSNVAIEPYGEFGVSWEVNFVSVHMLAPQYMPIIAYPNTWCRGTDGEVRGKAVYINVDEIDAQSDLEQYRGKLAGAIVFIEPIQELKPTWEPLARRLDERQLDMLAEENITQQMRRDRPDGQESRGITRKQVIDFLFAEGTAAIAAPDGEANYGTVLVNEVRGKAWENPSAIHPPFLVLAAEHYNRVMRILEKKIDVELLVDMKISISDNERTDHNVIAELPGSDLKDEVVLIGAHLDANSAGTGATDNASGVTAVMEAMRILQAIGVRPRRTIRVALWGGEEYGLLGSKKYVENHYGGADGIPVKRAHEKLAIYINKDGGGGRVRGVQLQGNEQLRPILEKWIAAVRPLGVTHLTSQSSPNSDHAPFNDAGLPAVTFVQDPIETRAYHTNMDTYDRFVPEDVVQSAVVMAILSYQAAMRDTKIPRIAKQMNE